MRSDLLRPAVAAGVMAVVVLPQPVAFIRSHKSTMISEAHSSRMFGLPIGTGMGYELRSESVNISQSRTSLGGLVELGVGEADLMFDFVNGLDSAAIEFVPYSSDYDEDA